MINQDELIKKIEEVKQKYTFENDKANADSLIKRVRKLSLKKEITKNPVIQELISTLVSEIETITRFLAWDEKAKDEVREEKRIKRDAYIFLISFFGNPENELENIQKRVEGDIKLNEE